MFKYYKNLFKYQKNYLVNGEPRGGQVETPKTIRKFEGWEKSRNLVAWLYMTNNLQEKKYEVFVRPSKNWSWLLDIKIDDNFWNPIIFWVPPEQAQNAVNEFMKLDLTTILDKEIVWRNSRIELVALSENINNLSLEKILHYKNQFDGIMRDGKISSEELDNINYQDLKNVLSQAFSHDNYSKYFNEQKISLLNSIDHTIVWYRNINKKSNNSIINNKFEDLIKFRHRLLDSVVLGWIGLAESLENMTLQQLLEQYNTQDEWIRYLALQKIIDKFVTGKQNFLAYWNSWEIVIKASRIKNWKKEVWEANDNDSQNILSRVTQEDLKWIMLRDIIKSLWINIWKENVNYQLVIWKILEKYNIDWFVALDLINRPEELKKAIKQKLEQTDDINTIRDLSFVLDYINNQKSYPEKLIQESAAKSLLTWSKYDPTTGEWLDRLKEAAKNWKFIKTVFDDIRSSYGGATWALIMVWTIIWLFVPKWRKYAIWSILLQILGPAAEELSHKWLWDWLIKDLFEQNETSQSSWSSQNTASSSNSWFEVQNTRDIDFIVLHLPENYSKIYNKMYRENLKKAPEERIYEWDFAQIYAQLAQNMSVKNMTIENVQDGINSWKPIDEILWDANMPKKYQENLIKSKSWQKISNERRIYEKDVEKFMRLLLSVWEVSKDTTIWDLFAEWKDEINYMNEEVFQAENTEIYTFVSQISFWEARWEVEKVLSETQGFIVSNDTNENKKVKVNEIIEKLKLLQNTYSSEGEKIWAIIKVYDEIWIKLDVQISFDKWKNEANDAWELGSWMEFLNWAKEIWSKMIWFFKLSSSLALDSLNWINLDDLEKYIGEWKNLLKKDWISEKQKIEINEIIRKLREKKLAVLRLKDRKEKKSMSEKTKKEFSLLIKENMDEYKDKISWIELKNKPEPESMDSYKDLFFKNAQDIIFLQSIADSWSDLANSAKSELDAYNNVNNWFIANLQKYINWKKGELTEIKNGVSSLSLENIQSKIEKFEIIEKEFIGDWSYVKWFKDFIQSFWYEDIDDNPNNYKIIDFQNRYNQVLWTKVDLNWDEFYTELTETKTDINVKLTNLIAIENLPTVPDILSDQEIQTFITSAMAYKNKISKFKDSNSDLVNSKLSDLNWKILELEGKFTKLLEKDAQNDTQLNNYLGKNAKLSDSWKKLSEKLKNNLGYESTKFNDAYEQSIADLYISRIWNIPDFENLVTLKQNFENSSYNDISTKDKIERAFSDKTFELYTKEIEEAVNISKLIEIKDKYGVKSNFILKKVNSYVYKIKSEEYAKKFRERMMEMSFRNVYSHKMDLFTKFDGFTQDNGLAWEINSVFSAKMKDVFTILDNLINNNNKFKELDNNKKTEIKDIVNKMKKEYENYIETLLFN